MALSYIEGSEENARNEETTTTEEEKQSKRKLAPLTSDERAELVAQVTAEYNLAWDDTSERRTKALRRLKLYNNQKRDQSKVGDPLLFSIFQTVLSALYVDRLAVKFCGREEGDDEVEENLNAMAEYDYEAMGKDELDYEWDWDACFFGRSLMLFNEFDRPNMVPVAQVIDPMSFIRDPRATSVNGDKKGAGALRFGGWEVELTKGEMKGHPSYFNLNKVKKGKDIRSLSNEAKQARDEAQGRQVRKDGEENLIENYAYPVLRWFTIYQGEKCLVELANDRKVLIRYQKLNSKIWPIFDRTIFPMPKDWDGVSIPDLIEDKQRARSVLINLGMESAKADLYPMYLFDSKKIKNPRDLDFEFNKFVPVAGEVSNSIQPIQKSVFHQQVNLILNILDVAAQKAVAAPETSQGIQPQQGRTLGETELVAAGSAERRSLSAKVFGWSEKRFWTQWYVLYKKYFKEGLDEKILRIEGPLAPVWRKLTRENLVLDTDPDIKIDSTVIAEARRQAEFQKFSVFSQIALQDPQVNRRYILRKLGKISGLSKADLYLMFPPTIDELHAVDENSKIEDEKLPTVAFSDDDIVHLEIHNKAADNAAKLAHVEAHKKMMLFKKEHPELVPPPAQGMMELSPVNTPAQGGAPSRPARVPAMAGARGGMGPDMMGKQYGR